MKGCFIGFIGASGVGKDTVMSALANAHSKFFLVRRAITHPVVLGGKSYESASDDAFSVMKTDGAFCLDWQGAWFALWDPQ